MRRASIFVLLVTFLNPTYYAQRTQGSLAGTVADANGAVVPGAKVIVRGKAGLTVTSVTDGSGSFRFDRLPVGVYDVDVKAEGFSTKQITNIPLQVGQSASVNVVLSVGSLGPVGRTFKDPVWNLWAEPFSLSPTFSPVRLQPGHDYSLVVNIAALAYDAFEGPSVYSQDSSSAFSQWLKQHSSLESADLDLIIVPDTQYFQAQPPGEKQKNLHIELKKLRELQKKGFDLPKSPFQLLQVKGAKAPFSFGIQYFRLRTSSKLGNGSVALSVWADGKPIDELSFTACISAQEDDSCVAVPPTPVSLKGVDLSQNQKYPDAAMHFIDRGSDMVGVYRCNNCGWAKDDYRTWEIEESVDWFSARIKEISQLISKVPVSTPNEQDKILQTFQQAGDAIYNICFHSRDSGLPQVKAAFSDFIARAKGQKQRVPPSLFVRLIPGKPDLVIPPISLMRVHLPDNSSEFVGFNVNIETPLEFQDYSSQRDCISQWILFVPPKPKVDMDRLPSDLQEILAARVEFADWINVFTKSCNDCVKDDVNTFRQWLSQGSGTSNAVMILSHHSDNGLYFDTAPGTFPVSSSSIGRDFAIPSLVIMIACGTAQPGASEFVRNFNFHGINSVIATTTEVEGPMAGRFLTILMNLLRDHATDASYTISQARFEAVKALSTQPAGNPYGPKALEFILAGNGALRLCVPRDSAAPPVKQ